MVAQLPDHAAVWRATDPNAGWTRHDVLLAVLERRVTLLWATVATALGIKVSDADVSAPLNSGGTAPLATVEGKPDVQIKSLREIASWIRDS
ncbi:hypothetical protein ACFYOT_21845 [Saccharothrix saharensis]|uniref:hypothetical protein n=1 Tax=Saccharothrix saharensis TaxID=571190 RepID=UPI0036943E29